MFIFIFLLITPNTVRILGPKYNALYPLERGSRLFPAREVVGPDARVPYGHMAHRVRRAAAFLRRKGVGPGDVSDM